MTTQTILANRFRYTDDIFSFESSSSSETSEDVPKPGRLRRSQAKNIYEDEPDDSRNEFGVHLIDGERFEGIF